MNKRSVLAVLLPVLITACATGIVSTHPSAVAPVLAIASVPRLPPFDWKAARLDAAARNPATDVRLAPSSKGALGAWLVAGPWAAKTMDVDETKVRARLGVVVERDGELGVARKKPAPRWQLASSNEGPIDLRALFEDKSNDLVALAAGQLHVERAGHYFLLFSVDDGVRVVVDGTLVFARDDARPLRDEDDVVGLDLDAGDHDVVLRFHQRDGGWAFRARFVDGTFAPPAGSYLLLPGTSRDDAKELAARMSWVSLERAFDPIAAFYRPRLVVRFTEGAPRGVSLATTSKLDGGFDVSGGEVPLSSTGVGELVVTLPDVAPLSTTATVESVVAGRSVKVAFPARSRSEAALVRLAKTTRDGLPVGSLATVAYLEKRLLGLLSRGDADAEAQNDEAHEVDRIAESLEKGADPYADRTGFMRRAIRSRHDGEASEFGLYVPPWYKRGGRRAPLVVGLHGMNGFSLGMMRWLFGHDDPGREQAWEDRHLGVLPATDAIVITPQAHGNSMYRELGEDDVMQVVEWAMQTYAIDPSRVTITGPSMGGIGAASLPLRHPHVFAGAMPLCGYHSYLVRRDVVGHPIRPWERFLAEERSNVFWAENGEHLPLFVVHGTKDLPEANSGVLIDRYEKLGYFMQHEHPDSGHNVWQETYDELKGITWLLRRKVNQSPSHVRFKTTRTRWGKSAWVSVDELASETGWAEVDAAETKGQRIVLSSKGVSQLTLSPDKRPRSVEADGQTLVFDEGETIVLHRDGNAWTKGPATHASVFKHGTVTGPIRDVFHDALLFVYADGSEARANEEVARAFARVRFGVQVAYPIVSDTQFFSNREPLANDKALFLVGRDNTVLAALEKTAPMPIRVRAGAVTIGNETLAGVELGAAFIHPNPARPDRYLVVVAGADVPGLLRAMSLPDLLPDFVVWDEAVALSRGQVLLGGGALRAGGFFTKEWALPARTDDPLASAARGAAAKNEHDAMPSLP